MLMLISQQTRLIVLVLVSFFRGGGGPPLTSWYLDMGPVPTWSLGGMPLGLWWCPSGIVAAPLERVQVCQSCVRVKCVKNAYVNTRNNKGGLPPYQSNNSICVSSI